MKNKYMRLKAMLLAGTIALTSSSLIGCSSQNNKTDENQAATIQELTKHFGIGEHIISVPIVKDIRKSSFQYKYHAGYEPVGLSVTAYGKYTNIFGGGAIIYSNIEEVECSSSLTDKDGNILYLDFGTPMYNNENEYDSNDDIKEFNIGEHIISIPISEEDNRSNIFQYEYHEGYEVVGIATSAYGGYVDIFGGGAVLYKNITPVKCSRRDNGYTTFGIPVEIEKTKTLN